MCMSEGEVEQVCGEGVKESVIERVRMGEGKVRQVCCEGVKESVIERVRMGEGKVRQVCCALSTGASFFLSGTLYLPW